MFIYQIGNVVMRGFAKHSTPVKWRNTPTQNMTNSIIKFNTPYSLPEVANYSISGDLVCYKGLSPSKLLNDISKLGGRPYIDIIGYLPNDCCHDSADGTCAVCCGVSENGVKWYHTFGVVNSVSRDYEFSGDDIPLITIPLSLDVSANPFWQPLNKYLWFPYYSDNNLTVFELDETNYATYATGIVDTTVNSQLFFTHPSEVVPFHYEPEFVFYKRRFDNEYELFDPQYWSQMNETGRIKSSGLSTSALQEDYYVSTDLSHIKTNYAFSEFDGGNAATLDDLIITVSSELTPFTLDTSVSTLDISQVDVDIENYELTANGVTQTGITTSMNIIVGSNSIAPSFVMLNGYPLLYPDGTIYIPPWEYKHRHPGELIGTNNHVQITKPDSSISIAYLHEFMIN